MTKTLAAPPVQDHAIAQPPAQPMSAPLAPVIPLFGARDLPGSFDPKDPVHRKLWAHYVDEIAPGGSGATSAPAAVPAGHESHQIEIEIGHGSLTGAITLTIDQGTTGVPIPAGQWKALENTLAVKANGFAAELETAVLSDELDAQVLDGVQVAVDVSAMQVATDGSNASTHLLVIALKLQGDVSHWVKLGPQVAITLDGSIQLALGGELAAKLAKYVAAKLDREMYAREAEDVARQMEEHATAAKSLERRLAELEANPSADRRAIRGLEEEIATHKLHLGAGTRQLEELARELERADGEARKLLMGKIEGKLARSVAWAMEKKSIVFVADKLAKLVPILNVVSTVVDVVDLIGTIKRLIQHGVGHGGDGEGDAKDGAGVGPDTDGGANEVGGGRGKGDVSPVARRLVEALVGGSGVALDPDQMKVLSALIPADLTEVEMVEAITMLRGGGDPAKSPQDAMVAVEGAVRRVRDRRRTVSVNGVPRSDLQDAGSDADGPVTSPEQVDRPRAGGGTDAPVRDDVETIVRDAPPEVIATWFEVQGGNLVMSAAGYEWKARALHALVGDMHLVAVEPFMTSRGPGRWNVELKFTLKSLSGNKHIDHTFFVEQGTSMPVLGATANGLAFEPYTMIEL